jgi:hypothetical protein
MFVFHVKVRQVYYYLMTLSQQLRVKADELERVVLQLRQAADGLDMAGKPTIGMHPGVIVHPEVVQQQIVAARASNAARVAARAEMEEGSGIDLLTFILSEAGKPVSVEYIMTKLREHGRTLNEGTIQSYLSRNKRFTNWARGLWTLSLLAPAFPRPPEDQKGPG